MQRLTLGLILSLLGMAGCGREETIHSYRVPKQEVVYELNHAAGAAKPQAAAASRPERMLAAIVTHGAQGWFFKLTGPPEFVAKQVEGFDQFVRSLKFEDDKPKWTLPADWKETPGRDMRFATLLIEAGGEKPLELTVITLPRGEDEEPAYLLANINRWRGQVQLPPITARELGNETEKIELNGATAYVVDLEGTAADTGMGRAPFASGGGAGPLPQAAKPQAAASGGGALKYDAPAEWKAGRSGGLRKAAFDVIDGDQKVEITVIDLEPAAAELLPNVNRWREQVGLSEQTKAELDKELKSLPISGKQGQYVVLEGPGKAGTPQTILGVIVQHSGRVWFVKLMGDGPLAAREKERFEAFVKSVKFGAGED